MEVNSIVYHEPGKLFSIDQNNFLLDPSDVISSLSGYRDVVIKKPLFPSK